MSYYINHFHDNNKYFIIIFYNTNKEKLLNKEEIY